MKLSRLVPAALLPLIFIACNQPAADKNAANAPSSFKANYKTEDLPQLTYAAADSAAPQGNIKMQSPPAGKSSTNENWEKKIIKTATITLEVKNYKTFSELLHAGVKETGGYVAAEDQNQTDYKIENSITIKVPVDRFDDAVARLIPANETLVEKKISSEDVTTETVDTRARMEAKKRIRDRYVDLLKQAKNMDEILQVQNQIDEIQQQEEGAAGRLEYLSHASSWSTINLTYYQVLNPAANTPPAAPSYGARLAGSFKSGLAWFGDVLIFIISLWPLWLGLFAGWMVIRKFKPSTVKKQ